nr:hypothetical protein [Tanacetum cinerariifolium]
MPLLSQMRSVAPGCSTKLPEPVMGLQLVASTPRVLITPPVCTVRAAAVGEAIHVGDELQVGVGVVARVGEAQRSGGQQALVAEIGRSARRRWYSHVQAQHVANYRQEVVDERLTGRQRVATFARRQLVRNQVRHARVENRLDIHRARATGHA